jgi:hypothetical protein
LLKIAIDLNGVSLLAAWIRVRFAGMMMMMMIDGIGGSQAERDDTKLRNSF